MKKMNNRYLMVMILLIGVITAGCLSVQNLIAGEEKTQIAPCPPLPESFTADDLVGTWVAEYFGGEATDKLVIRADETYKQIYSSEWLNFKSEWKNWSLERRPDGLVLLHLDGMRRCDDIESICNHSEGGLPDNEMAINQCNEGNEGYISYSGEGILFVTGYPQDVPRGIVLRHPRLAGSEWTYSFRLNESANP
jgi:hypothetical protein